MPKSATSKGSVSSRHFIRPRRLDWGVAFDLAPKTEWYIDSQTGARKRRSSLTKNERFRMLLHVCVTNQIRFLLAKQVFTNEDGSTGILFFASLCAYVKLEGLKIKSGLNHFALKSKLSALKSACAELEKLEPQSAA